MTSFEQELESELHRLLDPMKAGQAVPTRRVGARPGRDLRKLLGGAGAALGVKVATGFAVAAVAATAAAAATEVAITGSVNPSEWGHQVTQQVAACKASAARLDVHGIGQCVSQFANQHGKAVSDSHKASAARENGNANDHGNGNSSANGHGNSTSANGNGNSNGNGNGNNGNDDKSKKAKSPPPGTSLDREPTDPPMVNQINLPPPPP